MATAARLARAHGLYNLASGLWPLVHYRSFEKASGPKADRWLVQTVAGLLAVVGYAMVRAGDTPEGTAAARRLGIGTAATLGAVDAVYGGRGRIRRIYLADAVLEAGWMAAWALARRGGGGPPGRPRSGVPAPDRPERGRPGDYLSSGTAPASNRSS